MGSSFTLSESVFASNFKYLTLLCLNSGSVLDATITLLLSARIFDSEDPIPYDPPINSIFFILNHQIVQLTFFFYRQISSQVFFEQKGNLQEHQEDQMVFYNGLHLPFQLHHLFL